MLHTRILCLLKVLMCITRDIDIEFGSQKHSLVFLYVFLSCKLQPTLHSVQLIENESDAVWHVMVYVRRTVHAVTRLFDVMRCVRRTVHAVTHLFDVMLCVRRIVHAVACLFDVMLCVRRTVHAVACLFDVMLCVRRTVHAVTRLFVS